MLPDRIFVRMLVLFRLIRAFVVRWFYSMNAISQKNLPFKLLAILR